MTARRILDVHSRKESRECVEGWICFRSTVSVVGVGAVGNTFESNRGLEEEGSGGTCGEVVVLVRIEFKVADKVTAGLVLELDDDVVGELVLCRWW